MAKYHSVVALTYTMVITSNRLRSIITELYIIGLITVAPSKYHNNWFVCFGRPIRKHHSSQLRRRTQFLISVIKLNILKLSFLNIYRALWKLNCMS
jgi:hypothetical protein